MIEDLKLCSLCVERATRFVTEVFKDLPQNSEEDGQPNEEQTQKIIAGLCEKHFKQIIEPVRSVKTGDVLQMYVLVGGTLEQEPVRVKFLRSGIVTVADKIDDEIEWKFELSTGKCISDNTGNRKVKRSIDPIRIIKPLKPIAKSQK